MKRGSNAQVASVMELLRIVKIASERVRSANTNMEMTSASKYIYAVENQLSGEAVASIVSHSIFLC